jgi:hypothetical protein
MRSRNPLGWLAAAALMAAMSSAPAGVAAHCDGLDGPVVVAARAALQGADVALALVWVRPEHEQEIRDAFTHTMAVRALGPRAKDLADTYFFETLVRIHRLGEGAPYDGLKAAGRDLGPAIPAADRALTSGDFEPLERLIHDAVQSGMRKRFEHARAAKSYRPTDVAGGRAYVEAYVSFIHYVERMYESAVSPVAGHTPDAARAGDHEGESHR